MRGFTLVEVLVAMALLAVVLAATGLAVRGNIRNLAALEERVLAHRVARNALNEVLLGPAFDAATTVRLGPGAGSGAAMELTMRLWDREFLVNVRPRSDEEAGMLEITVDVALLQAPDRIIDTLIWREALP